MQKKTNSGLVAWCIKLWNEGTGYVYGAFFDRIITLAYIMEKAGQYPKEYTTKYIERTKKWIGKNAGDCVGEIKAYVWLDEATGKVIYPKDQATRDLQDKSAEGMYNAASVKGDISTMPDIPGILVHMQDHVGVYIGNGEVIEARGVAYGVVKTNLKDRPWTRWSQCPFIDYSTEEESMLYIGCPISDAVGYWQTALLKQGYKMINDKGKECKVDNDFGSGTANGTKLFQADEGLPQTGEVDELTYGRMLDRLMKNNDAGSADLRAQLEAAQKTVKDRDATITSLSAEKLSLENTVKNRDSEIETLQKEIVVTAERTDADLKAKADKIAELESDLDKIESEHAFCAGDIQELTAQIDPLKAKVAELTKQLEQTTADTVKAATVGTLLGAIVGKLKPTIMALWNKIMSIK